MEDEGLEWRICSTEAGLGKRKPLQFLKPQGVLYQGITSWVLSLGRSVDTHFSYLFFFTIASVILDRLVRYLPRVSGLCGTTPLGVSTV
jgi:hypothetical protein